MAENFDRPEREPSRRWISQTRDLATRRLAVIQRRRPRQVVPDYVDWKDVDLLRQFVPERGKIMPRRISGISAKDQRRIATAIKRARSMAMLPFVQD